MPHDTYPPLDDTPPAWAGPVADETEYVRQLPLRRRKEALELLWSRGRIEWKLRDYQQKVDEDVERQPEKQVVVLDTNRGFGKTTYTAWRSLRGIMRSDNYTVRFLGPSAKETAFRLEERIIPMLADCPERLRPKWDAQNKVWRARHRNSCIYVAGLEHTKADDHRGPHPHEIILDETRNITDLENVWLNVIWPQLQQTRGRFISASTVATDLNHYYHRLIDFAKENGIYIKRRIQDMPGMTEARIDEIAAVYPKGRQDPRFRREMETEAVPDDSELAFPLYLPKREKLFINTVRPKTCFKYIAGDHGSVDPTAILFAHYDFDKGRLVVEDELGLDGPTNERGTTSMLQEYAEARRKQLWGTDAIKAAPFDAPVQMIRDMREADFAAGRENGIPWLRPPRMQILAAIRQLETMIEAESVIVGQRCRRLDEQLQRMPKPNDLGKVPRVAGLGHFDYVFALLYMIRVVVRSESPYPVTHMQPDGATFLQHAPAPLPASPQLTLSSKFRRSM